MFIPQISFEIFLLFYMRAFGQVNLACGTHIKSTLTFLGWLCRLPVLLEVVGYLIETLPVPDL